MNIIILFCITALATATILLGFLDPPYEQMYLFKGRTLFVTAHPDDEVMFFGPTISHSSWVYILCLSAGQGTANRTEELMNACKTIRAMKCSVDTSNQFVDGFDQNWNQTAIVRAVAEYAKENEIDRIVTFDSRGVSGHPNHMSIGDALKFYNIDDAYDFFNASAGPYVEGNNESVIPVYFLDSGSFISKYSGFVKALYASRYGKSTYRRAIFTVNSFDVAGRIINGFYNHKSQHTWYRKLWFAFSSFVYYNEVRLGNKMDLNKLV